MITPQKILRLIHDESFRLNVLSPYGLYNWMDDETYLKKVFRVKMGYDLNLDNPETFNEKLQWLKIHDRNPVYTKMVDKYEAKKYVSNIIGEQYIIPTIGVWERFDDIDFSKLPDQFVLKCTHDSGGLVVVRDKSTFDRLKAKKKINDCLKSNFFYYGREWPYKNVKPRIIAEKYMEDTGAEDLSISTNIQGLTDYKFFCFNSRANLLYISKGLEDHSTAGISFYDLKGKELSFHRKDYRPYHNAPLPKNLDEMIGVANILAEEIPSPFVRIDLYSIAGKIYFSEITFSPCSGFLPFDSHEADKTLGERISLLKKV